MPEHTFFIRDKNAALSWLERAPQHWGWINKTPVRLKKHDAKEVVKWGDYAVMRVSMNPETKEVNFIALRDKE